MFSESIQRCWGESSVCPALVLLSSVLSTLDIGLYAKINIEKESGIQPVKTWQSSIDLECIIN